MTKILQSPGSLVDTVFACILESSFDLAHDLVVNNLTQRDAAWFGQTLKPGRDIDAIAVDISFVDNHVTRGDADAELWRHLAESLVRPRVPADGTLHGIEDTLEFHR